MNPLDKLTPKEFDDRIRASRRLLAECRRWPNPDNIARMRTELGPLEILRRMAPEGKSEKVDRLIKAYLEAIPTGPEF